MVLGFEYNSIKLCQMRNMVVKPVKSVKLQVVFFRKVVINGGAR